MTGVRALHKHQLGTKSSCCSDLPAHEAEETRHGDPGAQAYRFLPFPALRCCPASRPGRGSRWLSPSLQASPSAAGGSYQLLAAHGGTTAAARVAQTADGQSTCLPMEQRSAQRAALAPSHHPGATQHLPHHFPPLQTRIPPSRLCSTGKQQDATVPILPVLGHATQAAPGGRPSSPGPSELCPGHTMPVMDKPHHLGPNPNLHQTAGGQASTLVPARGHQGRLLGHRNSHTSERLAPSKAAGDKAPPPHRNSMHGCVQGG